MEKKQNRFSPNYAIPPGETLRETLKALGMTQAELGRPPSRIPLRRKSKRNTIFAAIAGVENKRTVMRSEHDWKKL